MNKKILWLIAFLLLVSSNIGEAQAAEENFPDRLSSPCISLLWVSLVTSRIPARASRSRLR